MRVKLVLPESTADITVGQIQKYMKIREDGLETIPEVISIFCEVTKAEVIKLPYKYLSEAMSAIMKALETSETEPKYRFEFDGDVYGMIPDLSIDSLSFGEYVDLDTYFQVVQRDGENEFNYANAHKLLAVLYRRITKEAAGLYQIEPYEGSGKYADQFKGLPLSILQGALVFFCNLNNELLTVTRPYLEAVANSKSLTKNEQNSNVLTGGMEAFTALQDLMYLNTNKLLAYPYRRLCTHYHTWQTKKK